MLASIPIISPLFQILLNAMGWVMAEIYRFIPNYGVAIIVLTLIIKFALLPLGVKQIKSMQHMQAIQPRVKEIQKKYKGNKTKIQEETMKLYREAGVSPFGGCLPLLLTFPFLISMYAVIRMPILQPVPESASTAQTVTQYVVHNNHLPVDSRLFHDVITHENTGIGVMNLQCSPAQSGSAAVVLTDSARHPIVPDKPLLNGANAPPTPLPPDLTSRSTLDCGNGPTAKIPYFVLLALMVATTYYQQRQMNKANPPGASSNQQQAILRIMPLFMGFIGFGLPAGLGVYWTLSNIFQIGQQTVLMRAGHIGPDAIDRRIAEQKAKAAAAGDNPPKKGFLARMLEQQDTQRKLRDANPPPDRGSGGSGKRPSGGSSSRGRSGSGSASKGTSKDGPQQGPQGPRRRPNTGGGRKGGAPGPKKRPGGNGGGEGDGQNG